MEICLSDGQRLLVFGFHQDDMDAAIEAFNQLQLHEKVTHFFFSPLNGPARADALQRGWMEKAETFLSRSTAEKSNPAKTCLQ